MTTHIITPQEWGPHGWKFIHYVSLGYPENPTEEDKHKYKMFFISLKDVLPCSLCRNHYEENYATMPLTDVILSKRENVVRWVIDIHNVVNASKNKPIIPYDEALKLINGNSECAQNKMNLIYLLIAILGGLVLIAVIYKKN